MIAPEARGAWNELEARLRPYVARRVSSAADVDDVLQNVFIRMHQGLATLNDSERFGGWVYRIAQRVIFDTTRRRAREPWIPVAELPEPADADRVDDAEALQTALGECVALFVARLPTAYREAITLTELQGLTQSEAAERLGISLSAMKSRVQRGREKIRHMFDECCRISVDCRGRIVDCQSRGIEEIPSDCRDAARSWARRHGR